MTENQDLNKIDIEAKLIQDKYKEARNKSIPKISIMTSENGNDVSQNLPNVVQTVYDITEDDVATDSAQVDEQEVNNANDKVSNTNFGVSDTTTENKTCISENLKHNWTRHPKREVDDKEQDVSNDTNKLVVSKTEDTSETDRRKSLTVPAKVITDSKLSNDTRRESNGSNAKLSLLSSLSQRSLQGRTDFTIIQFPPDDKKSVPAYEDSWIRVAMPYLPLRLAVFCLVLNILVSGSGTIISGLCIFCCAKSRVPPKYDQDPLLISCVNLWVGLAQLFTVTFLLVGWFWSIAWGIRMVILALEHQRDLKEQRETQLKQQTIDAFGKTLTRRL